MLGKGKLEQAFRKFSLLKETEVYLMSVAQCRQARVVAAVSSSTWIESLP